jgi:hypothetical protein
MQINSAGFVQRYYAMLQWQQGTGKYLSSTKSIGFKYTGLVNYYYYWLLFKRLISVIIGK